MEKKTLNLDTFNDVLFGAFKDQFPKSFKELLTMELDMAMSLKISKMEELVEALDRCLPYHTILEEIHNIDSNLDRLAEKLKELEEQNPELREEQDGEV